MTRGARATTPASRRAGVVAGLLAVVAVAVGGASAVEPVLVLAVVVGCSAVAVMTLRLQTAVLVYVAAEPFSGYLSELSGAAVKLVGLIVFVAWALRLATDDRPPALRHRVVYAALALAVVVLAALVVHPHGSAGLVVTSRYLSYIAVLVVLVDTLRRGLDAWQVARTLVLSSALAAALGVVTFLQQGGRAAGPIEDANDFALHLLCAVPFAIALARRPGAHRAVWAVAGVALAVGIAATFSRGALLGLGVVVVLGLALRLLRRRTAVLGALAVAAALLVALVVTPDLIQRSLDEKQHVADANVTSRFIGWTIAAEMTADHPLLGTGPAGYGLHYDDYLGSRVSDPPHLDVAHQMFLDVASELGLLGLAAFLMTVLSGIWAAWRARARAVRPSDTWLLATTVCVGFGGVLTGAMFLSSQFYLPVWLLLALAVAVATGPAPAPRAVGPALVHPAPSGRDA